MVAGTDDVVGWIFKGVVAIIVSVFGFMFKRRADDIDTTLDKHDDQIADIDKEVVRLKADTVSESKVRDIVKTELETGIHPLVKAFEEMQVDIGEQKQATQHLLLALAEQKGRNEVLKELGKN